MACYDSSERPIYQLKVWLRRFEWFARNPDQFLLDPLYIDEFVERGKHFADRCEDAPKRKAMLGILHSIAMVAAQTRQMRLAMFLANSQLFRQTS
jgi:hypothetical protein